jgi:hypothetical protein
MTGYEGNGKQGLDCMQETEQPCTGLKKQTCRTLAHVSAI